jgi:hypothetical protein
MRLFVSFQKQRVYWTQVEHYPRDSVLCVSVGRRQFRNPETELRLDPHTLSGDSGHLPTAPITSSFTHTENTAVSRRQAWGRGKRAHQQDWWWASKKRKDGMREKSVSSFTEENPEVVNGKQAPHPNSSYSTRTTLPSPPVLSRTLLSISPVPLSLRHSMVQTGVSSCYAQRLWN